MEIKEFLGICKVDSNSKRLDDAVEVKCDSNKTMKSMIGKEAGKKLNNVGKTHLQGPTKLVRVAQKTQTTMEKKNGPHQKMEEGFLQRERVLPKKEPPLRLSPLAR